ncbi:MAG: hypothetical protein ACW980_23440 [Promethearchaeota archaeon]|jgi:hypothetical protein
MERPFKIVLGVYIIVGLIFWGLLISIMFTPTTSVTDAALGPVIVLFFWIIEGVCILPKIFKRHKSQKQK